MSHPFPEFIRGGGPVEPLSTGPYFLPRPPLHLLDSGRRRDITPPPLPALERSPEADVPQCSFLLSRLPLEVRQLIWEEVLGGLAIHISLRAGGFSHDICLSPNLEACYCFRRVCSALRQQHEILRERRQLLSLPLTCRQVYSEAINYLYSSNTFITSDHRVMQYLPSLILPQRLRTIRSIRFYWEDMDLPPILRDPTASIPSLLWAREPTVVNEMEVASMVERLVYRRASWISIWHNLASLRDLRSLHVKLEAGDNWENLGPEYTTDLLAPIKDVTKPDDFVLSLPFLRREGLPYPDPWVELPCEVRRVQGFHNLKIQN